MKIRRKNLGFTLIELLAVIVILAVLLGIAIPMVSGYMTNSRKDSYIDSIKLYIDDVKAKQAIREYIFNNPNIFSPKKFNIINKIYYIFYTFIIYSFKNKSFQFINVFSLYLINFLHNIFLHILC